GRRVRAMIEDARQTLARAGAARAADAVFASGATEALHLATSAAGAASLVVAATPPARACCHTPKDARADRSAPPGATPAAGPAAPRTPPVAFASARSPFAASSNPAATPKICSLTSWEAKYAAEPPSAMLRLPLVPPPC